MGKTTHSRDEIIAYIHGDLEHVIVRRPLTFTSHGKLEVSYVTVQWKDVSRLAATPCDLYWLQNTGGTRGADITGFHSVFFDLDAGRTGDGGYLDLALVQEFKRLCRKALVQLRKTLAITVNVLVETRNGYQGYIKLADEIDADTFRLLQKKIIGWFNTRPYIAEFGDAYLLKRSKTGVPSWGADRTIHNPSRLMRLPDSLWHKPKEGLPPFHVRGRIIHRASTPSTILLNAFADVPIVQRHFRREHVENFRTGVDADHAGSNVALIRAGDKAALQTTIEPYGIAFDTFVAARDHLRRTVDLASFLGVSKRHQCIFHEDNSDSADIFIGANGAHLYCCHSDHCDFHVGDIVPVVSTLMQTTLTDAEDWLLDLFDIRISQSSDALDKFAEFSAIKTLFDCDLQHSYPALYACVKVDTPLMQRLLDLSIANLRKDQYLVGGCTYFFGSVRYLSRGLASPQRINKGLVLLALLGLLTRHRTSDLPQKLMEEAQMFSSRRHDHNTTSYFSLPAMTPEVLAKAEWTALRLDTYGVTRDGLTYDAIYRLFGSARADACYPSRDGFPTDSDDDEIYEIVKHCLEVMIRDNPCVTLLCLIERIKTDYSVVFGEEQSDEKIRRSIRLKLEKMLPALCAEIGLTRTRLTKSIKHRHGLTAVPGYGICLLSDT